MHAYTHARTHARTHAHKPNARAIWLALLLMRVGFWPIGRLIWFECRVYIDARARQGDRACLRACMHLLNTLLRVHATNSCAFVGSYDRPVYPLRAQVSPPSAVFRPTMVGKVLRSVVQDFLQKPP